MRPISSSAMRRTLIRSMLVGIAMLGGWLGTAAPAEAATQITSCPFVISQPGQYALAANLTCPNPGNAILITASDVHLTLAGFTLTGPNNGTGVGIKVEGTAASPLTDVHINGGTVQKFGIGISLLYVNESHVNGMISQDNVLGALSGDGIKLEHATDNHVNGNTFTRNNGFGVRLVDADGNRFNTNVVTENVGLQRDGGFFLTEGSTDNRITSCDISRNGEVGFWIFDRASVRNLIQGCLVNDNNVLMDTAMAGIVIVSSNNTLRGNEVSRNRVGISITAGATGNLIQSNTALDNRIRDMQDFNLPQCVNTWKSNTFVVDNETGAAFGPNAGCIR